MQNEKKEREREKKIIWLKRKRQKTFRWKIQILALLDKNIVVTQKLKEFNDKMVNFTIHWVL